MAEVIKGLGVVWSTNAFSAVVATPSGVDIGTTSGTSYGKIQSISYDHAADKTEVKGDDGEVKAVIFSNTTEKITITVVPTGVDVATARTNNVLPTIGSAVTITDTDDTELNSAVYMYEGGSKNRTVDGAATLTFNLMRYGLATMATV